VPIVIRQVPTSAVTEQIRTAYAMKVVVMAARTGLITGVRSGFEAQMDPAASTDFPPGDDPEDDQKRNSDACDLL
jgi:hypothetical protein